MKGSSETSTTETLHQKQPSCTEDNDIGHLMRLERRHSSPFNLTFDPPFRESLLKKKLLELCTNINLCCEVYFPHSTKKEVSLSFMYRCYVSVFLSHITFTNITSVSQIDVNVEGTTGSLQKVEIVPLLK